MPRLGYFGALLGLAALLSAPLVAHSDAQNDAEKEAQNHAPPTPSGARVQHVLVRGSGAAMEVEIQTSGNPVAPDTQVITGPDRIVVDFPGALPAAELRALEVNRGALKRVRTGLFFNNPPITRIVLDLAEPQSYRISTTRNAVVIKLGDQSDQGQVNLGETKQVPVNAGQAKLHRRRSDQARTQATYVAPRQPQNFRTRCCLRARKLRLPRFRPWSPIPWFLQRTRRCPWSGRCCSHFRHRRL